MADATGRPQRMRYSFEARCRAVALMGTGVRPGTAAQTVGASRASGYRWWARFKAEGWAGLRERRSTPLRQPRRLSAAAEAEILAARRRSGAGPVTLGALLGRPASTVGKVLRRLGCSRRPRAPRPPVLRYERARPGDLLHLDTKKLGRFWHVGKRILNDGVQHSRHAGWQHVHVAVDDHSRLAYAEVRASDRQGDALAFLERALAWFRAQGLPGARGDDGQRLRLSVARVAAAVHRARATALAHAPLHAPHERQGRALHPDAAAELGLRPGLPIERPPHAGAGRLAPVV